MVAPNPRRIHPGLWVQPYALSPTPLCFGFSYSSYSTKYLPPLQWLSILTHTIIQPHCKQGGKSTSSFRARLKSHNYVGEFGRRMNGEKELSVSTAFLHMAIHVICLLSLSPQSLSDVCAPVNFGSGTEAAQNSLFPSLRFWGQRCVHRKQIRSAFFLCRKLWRFWWEWLPWVSIFECLVPS